jgi:Tol biopolymer transport system component
MKPMEKAGHPLLATAVNDRAGVQNWGTQDLGNEQPSLTSMPPMNGFLIGDLREMGGLVPPALRVLGMAAFVLLVSTPSPTAAQQPPRRFFVLTMDEVNAKKTFNAKDALAVIERDGTSWTQFNHEIERGGRLSPDTMKYAWVEHGSAEKPAATLQILDLQKNAPAIKVPFHGIVGHCYWSRDGRELVISMLSAVKEERTHQTWRVSADGLKTVKLPIPATEFVQDWSRDGRWLVTTSARHEPGENPIIQTLLQDVRIIHPDGTGDRVFRRGTGSSKQGRIVTPTSTKSTPLFSPDSGSLLWIETDAASGNRQPAELNPIRIMVQRLTEDTPKEVMRAGGEGKRLAFVCWSPDSRSLVLHIQDNGSRRATDSHFEVFDLSGRPIRSVSARGVPDASTRLITYMIDCR